MHSLSHQQASSVPIIQDQISWGSGQQHLLFNAELPAGVSTHRAYRLPWRPAS
jgi:hypothetical protein